MCLCVLVGSSGHDYSKDHTYQFANSLPMIFVISPTNWYPPFPAVNARLPSMMGREYTYIYYVVDARVLLLAIWQNVLSLLTNGLLKRRGFLKWSMAFKLVHLK